jgi:hypothetical protein
LAPEQVAVPSGQDRALLWTEWQTVNGQKEALARVTMPMWNGTPVVEESAPFPTRRNYPASCRVTEPTPTEVQVRLPYPQAGGLLTVADARHPGWSVHVDGKARDLLRVNGAMRGVWIEKGEQRVQFRYNPATVRVGLFFSLVGIGILTAMLGSVFVARWFLAPATHRRDTPREVT